MKGKRKVEQLEREDGRVFTAETPDQLAHFQMDALQHAKGPRVLEIGCGDGRLTRALVRHGFDVTALESKSHLADQARHSSGARVINTSIFNFTDAAPYQTIVMLGSLARVGKLDVLEKLFAQIDAVTEPGTLFIADSVNPRRPQGIDVAYRSLISRQGRYIGENRMRVVKGDQRGDWFDWLYLDPSTLSNVAERYGWWTEICGSASRATATGQDVYLAYMVKCKVN